MIKYNLMACRASQSLDAKMADKILTEIQDELIGGCSNYLHRPDGFQASDRWFRSGHQVALLEAETAPRQVSKCRYRQPQYQTTLES